MQRWEGNHTLREGNSMSKGPEVRPRMSWEEMRNSLCLEPRMYLKGQRTPAHRLGIGFCRLGLLVGLFMLWAGSALVIGVCICLCCPQECEMGMRWYGVGGGQGEYSPSAWAKRAKELAECREIEGLERWFLYWVPRHSTVVPQGTGR